MNAKTELNRLLQSPAMRPPPGVMPNLKNPPVHFFEERLLTMIMCLTFTTLFVTMRMYTKLFVIRTHGWEDCRLAFCMMKSF